MFHKSIKNNIFSPPPPNSSRALVTKLSTSQHGSTNRTRPFGDQSAWPHGTKAYARSCGIFLYAVAVVCHATRAVRSRPARLDARPVSSQEVTFLRGRAGTTGTRPLTGWSRRERRPDRERAEHLFRYIGNDNNLTEEDTKWSRF